MTFNLNPTENKYPYKKDDTFKDSQVTYDPDLDIIIISVPVSYPQNIIELTSGDDVSIHVDIVFCTGTFTVNLVDASTAIKQVVVRSLSGTITITADAGTVETTTLTTGQATTLVPRASGWYEV